MTRPDASFDSDPVRGSLRIAKKGGDVMEFLVRDVRRRLATAGKSPSFLATWEKAIRSLHRRRPDAESNPVRK